VGVAGGLARPVAGRVDLALEGRVEAAVPVELELPVDVLEQAAHPGFRELARAIDGISDSMLSTRLTALTEAGLVTRTVDEGPPLSVAYALTEAGEALVPALAQISRWAEDYLPEPARV
jgi:DNA-binding HxlR family transcriptional regulator